MHSSVKSPLRHATVAGCQEDWLEDQSSDSVFLRSGQMPAELVGYLQYWSDASRAGQISAVLVGCQ
jgi:hypothetical protein